MIDLRVKMGQLLRICQTRRSAPSRRPVRITSSVTLLPEPPQEASANTATLERTSLIPGLAKLRGRKKT